MNLENFRRTSKENITLIKPRENKRGNECADGFERKLLSDKKHVFCMYVTEIKCKSVRGHGMFGGHGRQNETTKTSK